MYIKKIHIMLLILVLISFMYSVVCEKIDPAFTKAYFVSKNIEQIVVFACWNESDIFYHYQQIRQTYIKTSYQKIQENLDIKHILKVNYYKLGVILDLDCPTSTIIFDQFSAARLPFNESYFWLCITSASEVPTAILNELPLTVESEFTVALDHKHAYMLYDVYNHAYRHGGQLNVTSMGHWNENELENHLTQYKYKRRQNFHGITLNVSFVLMNEPKPNLETYLTTPIDPHLDTMIRFHYALTLQLRDMYNFKINLKQSKTWGYLYNGTFNGILGDMVNGIVDISAAPFQFKKERLDACEFTVATYVVKPYFMFRHPKKNTVNNPFLKPFKENVWCIGLSISIICWLLLFLTVKIEKSYDSEKRSNYYSNASMEIALITFAAISQQGLTEGPQVYSGRIVFITLFVWALLMYQFYSASIVGSLLSATPRFINNLIDLANSDLFIAFEDMPYTRDFVKVCLQFIMYMVLSSETTTDPTGLYLLKKKAKTSSQKKKLFTTAEKGIQEMRKGGSAFFIDSATGYKLIKDTFEQYQICELAEIELVPPQYVSIVTSKHSPFKKMVIYGLRQIVQSGITHRLFRIWHHRKPNCPESFRSRPVPVELQEFSPAMFIIIGGFMLATIIMSVEHLVKHIKFENRYC